MFIKCKCVFYILRINSDYLPTSLFNGDKLFFCDVGTKFFYVVFPSSCFKWSSYTSFILVISELAKSRFGICLNVLQNWASIHHHVSSDLLVWHTCELSCVCVPSCLFVFSCLFMLVYLCIFVCVCVGTCVCVCGEMGRY